MTLTQLSQEPSRLSLQSATAMSNRNTHRTVAQFTRPSQLTLQPASNTHHIVSQFNMSMSSLLQRPLFRISNLQVGRDLDFLYVLNTDNHQAWQLPFKSYVSDIALAELRTRGFGILEYDKIRSRNDLNWHEMTAEEYKIVYKTVSKWMSMEAMEDIYIIPPHSLRFAQH